MNVSLPSADSRRLFFALWPPADISTALGQFTHEMLGNNRGRPVAPENIHLTLIFLGTVSVDFRNCAEQVAAQVTTGAFTLVLDRLGYWPRKGIFWIGGEPPAGLTALQQALQTGLQRCGYVPENRRFQAHLTLARNVRALSLEQGRVIPPREWRAQRFALVASQTLSAGSRYEVVRNWKLSG